MKHDPVLKVMMVPSPNGWRVTFVRRSSGFNTSSDTTLVPGIDKALELIASTIAVDGYFQHSPI